MACISRLKPSLNPTPLIVGFVVDKVVMEQVLLRVLQIPHPVSLHLYSILILSSPTLLNLTASLNNTLKNCQLTCGTAPLPKMPFRTAIHRPTMTSSLTFSIMAAASPATKARSTGARYKFQKRKSSPKNTNCSSPSCLTQTESTDEKISNNTAGKTTFLRFRFLTASVS